MIWIWSCPSASTNYRVAHEARPGAADPRRGFLAEETLQTTGVGGRPALAPRLVPTSLPRSWMKTYPFHQKLPWIHHLGFRMWSQTQMHGQNDSPSFFPIAPLILLCHICTGVWCFSTWWQLMPWLLVWFFSPLFYAQDCSLGGLLECWARLPTAQHCSATTACACAGHTLLSTQGCNPYMNPGAICFRSLQILQKKVKYTVKNCTLHNRLPRSIVRQNPIITLIIL